MFHRRTFLVQVRDPETGVVVEDVQRRQRVRLESLAELPDQVERWLDAGHDPDPAVVIEEEP